MSPALRVSFALLVELLPALKPGFLPSISPEDWPPLRRRLHHYAWRSAVCKQVDGRQTALQKLRESTNGWGAIYMNPSGSRCSFRAQVPETVLCQCFSSRDYIYWLESMAQLISIVVPMTRSRPQQKEL